MSYYTFIYMYIYIHIIFKLHIKCTQLDNQLLCNLSIKLNSIVTYTALAINSYKKWELV